MTFDLRDINFHYNGVSEDHNILYDCESSGCDDEGICRCGYITEAYVTEVDITRISNIIYDIINDDNEQSIKRNVKLDLLLNGYGKDMDLYMIDRVLRKWKVYDPDSWDLEICNGYYGQEIDQITLKYNICDELNTEIIKALSIEPLGERVEYLLKLEYGKILPELRDCEWSLEIVDLDKVTFGSDFHVKRCKKEIEAGSLKYRGYFYDDKNYNTVLTKLIRGVALQKGENYRLIDGYHRCLSTGNNRVKLLIAKK